MIRTMNIRLPLFLSAAFMLLAVCGPVRADTNDHAVVEDKRGGVVYNTTGNCVRTRWMDAGNPCAPQQAPPPPPQQVVVVQPPPPPPVKHTVISEEARTVYFPFNKTGLTTQAKEQLDTLASTLKSANDIAAAKVVGAADRIGGVKYNDKLSEKRAEAVRDYLIARGYTNASVTKTRWVGKSEPVTSCSKKLPHKKLVACLQGDRRVHIEMVYKKEVITQAPPPPAVPVLVPAPATSTASPPASMPPAIVPPR